MKKNILNTHVLTGFICLASLLIIASGCIKNPVNELKDFNQVNFVANNNEYSAARVDPSFINGWGLAFGPTGAAWVSVANSGLSEVWDKSGNVLIPAVTIPAPGDAGSGGHPSGQLFNATSNFKLSNGNPAKFIFAGLDGVISGWNGGPAALTAIDDSKSHAVYTGIALASDEGVNFLYVANFSAQKIDVYDTSWAEVEKPFKDIYLPSGYSPFNVQTINNLLYVMYAKVGANGEEEKGAGEGYVDIYKPNGHLVKRFITKGALNAPWGIVQAPDDFFNGMNMPLIHNAILVGNFGDGHINVYDNAGKCIGPLRSKGKALEIDGLWGIAFAPATATSVNPNWLYFAAGPDDEENGLFGYVSK